MRTIRLAWLPLLVPSLLAAQPAIPVSPERDIVAVVSSTPLSDTEAVPGLLAGQRIMDGLRSALELVRGGVPDAARPGLEELRQELRRLQAGESSISPLPASYRSGGELWLPVAVQSLRVQLDAPDLLPRPRPEHAGGQVGNLPARARRTDRLPVSLTVQRVEEVLPLLSAGAGGQEQAQQLLETALRGARSSLELQHRPLILAYYGVESALAVAPHWDDPIRDRLRQAAEALNGEAGTSELADRMQAQADRLTADVGALQDLALTLRRQITRAAGSRPAEGRK